MNDRRSPTSLRVRYAGLGDHTGYAEAARRLCAAGRDLGLALDWREVKHFPDRRPHGWYPVDPPFDDGPGPGDAWPLLVGHTPIDTTPGYRAALPHRRFVNHTVWETDAMPPAWLPMLHDRSLPVDAVIVPTEWNAQTFRDAGVRIPVHVLPHVAPAPLLDAEPAALPLELPDDHLVFTTVSVWHSRKAPDRSITAFLRAFTGDDPVTMVVKTDSEVVHWDASYRPDVTAQTWYRLANLLRGHRNPPRIVLAVDPWDDARMRALYARTDCYVSLPSGEGWGLGAFDVAARGTPVVTTGFGGALAYLGADHPGLVEHTLVPAVVDNRGTVIGQWAEPDVDHAAHLLRTVLTDQAGWRRAADRTRLHIAATCSAEVVGATFRSIVAQHT